MRKPKKMNEILEMCKELVEATRKEQGCLTYEVFLHVNDPSVFTMIEEWEKPGKSGCPYEIRTFLQDHSRYWEIPAERYRSGYLHKNFIICSFLKTEPPEIAKIGNNILFSWFG